MVRVVMHPDRRRTAIVEAACQVFLQKGYEAATMQDVMRMLGIAKGTIYHYFQSKDQLLDAVLELLAEAEQQRIQTVFDGLRGNALERLQALILNISYESHDPAFIDNLHKPANAGMHIRLHARLLLILAPFFAELFALGKEEGLFSVKYPLECAEFILSAITFITDKGIYPWNTEQMERRIQAIPTIVEQQLAAPAGSFLFLQHLLYSSMKQTLGQQTDK